MLSPTDFPNDLDTLKAMLVAAGARDQRKQERIDRLELLVAAFKQAMFGRKSERLDPDQFGLALEDIETGIAMIKAEEEICEVTPKPAVSSPRAANRGSLPKHLPRVEEVIEPDASVCGCGARHGSRTSGAPWLALHLIGEDVSERLDVIPAQFRVILTRRPKYACRSCTNGVVQAPAPARLIAGGMPTEATVAHVPPLGDASVACRATGLQIRRPPAALAPSADLQLPRHRSGSLDAGGLGRQGGL